MSNMSNSIAASSLNEQIITRMDELAALRRREVKALIARHPDASVEVYTLYGRRAIVNLIVRLGRVDDDVPLEEVADFVGSEGYTVSKTFTLKEIEKRDGGTITVRMIVSANKALTEEEKDLLRGLGKLRREVQSYDSFTC